MRDGLLYTALMFFVTIGMYVVAVAVLQFAPCWALNAWNTPNNRIAECRVVMPE